VVALELVVEHRNLRGFIDGRGLFVYISYACFSLGHVSRSVRDPLSNNGLSRIVIVRVVDFEIRSNHCLVLRTRTDVVAKDILYVFKANLQLF